MNDRTDPCGTCLPLAEVCGVPPTFQARRSRSKLRDQRAVREYERLLSEATPVDMLKVHLEEYGRLTPAQRDLLLDQLLTRILEHDGSAANDIDLRGWSLARRAGRLVLRALRLLAIADPASPHAPGFVSYVIGGYRLIWFDPDLARHLPENAAGSDHLKS